MPLYRFFEPQVFQIGRKIELSPWAAHHLISVLRLKIGTKIMLFNNEGGEWQADIIAIKKKIVQVEILEFFSKENESPLYLHLNLGILHSDRMDLALQKATELGVTHITPLITEYSLKLRPQQFENRLRHWENIILHAAEQSGRHRLPLMDEPRLFLNEIKTKKTSLQFILHPKASGSLLKFKSYKKITAISLWIGPEGGFSDKEIEKAKMEAFESMALGPRILRTETAVISAITLLQFLYGDLSND